jgi:hypothetical protein
MKFLIEITSILAFHHHRRVEGGGRQIVHLKCLYINAGKPKSETDMNSVKYEALSHS